MIPESKQSNEPGPVRVDSDKHIKRVWRIIRFSFVQAAVLTRWLNQALLGTVWGVFVVTLMLYFWIVPLLLDVETLSFGEVVIWFSELSEGAQVAAGAALLTAIGLVAAYWTAMSVWRRQRFIEIRMSAGENIQNRCQAAMRITYDLGAYLSTLIDAVSRVRIAKNEDDARFALYYVNSQAAEFQRRAKELHEVRMELKGLFSSYGAVIVGTWHVWKHLDLFNASIDEFWDACAFLPPYAQFDSADFLSTFLSRYNEERIIDAHNIYERMIREGAPHAGFVHGILTQASMPLTLATVISLFRHQKLMRHGVNVIAEAKPRPIEFE